MIAGLVMDEIHEDKVFDELPENGNSDFSKSPNNVPHVGASGVVERSMGELYDNLCDMQSSDQSVSMLTYGSDGEESMIDSELRHLVGGEMKEVEIIKKDDDFSKQNDDEISNSHSSKNSKSSRSSPRTKTHQTKTDKRSRKPISGVDQSSNSNLGPFFLKQARDLISSGTNPRKALELSLRAASCFEKSANGKPNLDVVMCMHVTAAIYCNLGQYDEAIPVLENSIEIPVVNEGQDHALAKFSGLMQLADTYSMLGQLQNSIKCYEFGLEVQREALGDTDSRIGETCRYLSEAHVQALQFKEAEKFCEMALEIDKKNGLSSEEAADRRLMGLILETKGDHEGALEHLNLASMTMAANGQEHEVSFIDLSIGDTYLSLSRYDEAISAYQKSLASLKMSKGENHPSVASVYTRLADLCNKTGKLQESKTHCENALRIYENHVSVIPPEEIACGFTNIATIYESKNELDRALELLHEALKIYNEVPGHQNTIAGIEAQMGVMYYMLGKYTESYDSFKNAISKLRVNEKKSGFYGVALNQMGLTCIQLYAINEAIEWFEEARKVLEIECGVLHSDTLAVYSNLAGAYDAVGRVDDAIEILEQIVEMREEKLGTAGVEVDDEKKRLAELLKEAGKVRSREVRSFEHFLDSKNDSVEV